MHTIAIKTNDGRSLPVACAAEFSEHVGPYQYRFAVTKRLHVDPNIPRQWTLTHVDSGLAVCEMEELRGTLSLSQPDALEAGKAALARIIARHTVAVVASKLYQAMPEKPTPIAHAGREIAEWLDPQGTLRASGLLVVA